MVRAKFQVLTAKKQMFAGLESCKKKLSSEKRFQKREYFDEFNSTLRHFDTSAGSVHRKLSASQAQCIAAEVPRIGLVIQWLLPGGGDWGVARRPLTGLRALSKWAAREMYAELLIGIKTLSGVLGLNAALNITEFVIQYIPQADPCL